jgi:hypothetical protein
MKSRSRVLAATLAALLSLGAVACEVDDTGDPLQDDTGIEVTPTE